jgi:hypothetical protein
MFSPLILSTCAGIAAHRLWARREEIETDTAAGRRQILVLVYPAPEAGGIGLVGCQVHLDKEDHSTVEAAHVEGTPHNDPFTRDIVAAWNSYDPELVIPTIVMDLASGRSGLMISLLPWADPEAAEAQKQAVVDAIRAGDAGPPQG